MCDRFAAGGISTHDGNVVDKGVSALTYSREVLLRHLCRWRLVRRVACVPSAPVPGPLRRCAGMEFFPAQERAAVMGKRPCNALDELTVQEEGISLRRDGVVASSSLVTQSVALVAPDPCTPACARLPQATQSAEAWPVPGCCSINACVAASAPVASASSIKLFDKCKQVCGTYHDYRKLRQSESCYSKFDALLFKRWEDDGRCELRVPWGHSLHCMSKQQLSC